jgi:hypothetical protein
MLDCAYFLYGCRGSIRFGALLPFADLFWIRLHAAHNTRHTIVFFYFGEELQRLYIHQSGGMDARADMADSAERNWTHDKASPQDILRIT